VSDEDESDEDADLTPTMQALLQAADCFVSPAPIPHILLLAPLTPRAAREGASAIAALHRLGWLTAPVPATALLTARSQAFLATRHSDETIRMMVVQALCITVSNLVEARDEATLRLVEPHLDALTNAWQSRNDRYALALNLAMGSYLNTFGGSDQASPYLERATALAGTLGAGPAKPRRPWWSWR
jgi:hypothetical protein